MNNKIIISNYIFFLYFSIKNKCKYKIDKPDFGKYIKFKN